ncbi:hypothetical protein AB7W94_22505 [Providencia rettgeri]
MLIISQEGDNELPILRRMLQGCPPNVEGRFHLIEIEETDSDSD